MKLLKNAFYILLPLILGIVVAVFIGKYMDYNYLIQPLLAPPAFIFPIVWTIIYILMGISFYLYKRDTLGDNIDTVYYLQLAANILWPIIFFVLKFRFIATIWIVILDILVIYLLKLFFKYSRTSGYLNILYLAWIIFATYLTFSIYLLN